MMKYCYTFLFVFIATSIFAQKQEEDLRPNTGTVWVSTLSYAFQNPASDMADRFGYNFNLGLHTEVMLKKSNLIFGLSGDILFGNEVKEDVLESLRTPEGDIIGNNRLIADVSLRERGFNISGYTGILIPLLKRNRRSGIRVTLGAGLLQHKVRIQDNQNTIVQITGEYIKGYDRLSNGLSLTQFIGYQHLDRKRLVNFYVGVEFVEGFTENRRTYNFDIMGHDDTQRRDILVGIRLGWSVPLYIGEDAEEIFY